MENVCNKFYPEINEPLIVDFVQYGASQITEKQFINIARHLCKCLDCAHDTSMLYQMHSAMIEQVEYSSPMELKSEGGSDRAEEIIRINEKRLKLKKRFEYTGKIIEDIKKIHYD